MSCNGNCKCKYESKIETVWVESEIGEQLMFAVPEESQNEPTVDMIKQIESEILNAFDESYEILEFMHLVSTATGHAQGLNVTEAKMKTLEFVKNKIEKIFEKYR